MRSILAILLMFPLMGCSSRMVTEETNLTVCSVWKDVTWSAKDTPQTIVEVKINNARRDGWCSKPKTMLW